MGTSSEERRRNRSWPEALKREIVAASLAPGSSVSVAARRYDVNANQVFAWRRRYRPDVAPAAEMRLVPVSVTPDRPTAAAATVTQPDEAIEITLANGYRIRIGAGVKAAALQRVLDVLERR